MNPNIWVIKGEGTPFGNMHVPNIWVIKVIRKTKLVTLMDSIDGTEVHAKQKMLPESQLSGSTLMMRFKVLLIKLHAFKRILY